MLFKKQIALLLVGMNVLLCSATGAPEGAAHHVCFFACSPFFVARNLWNGVKKLPGYLPPMPECVKKNCQSLKNSAKENWHSFTNGVAEKSTNALHNAKDTFESAKMSVNTTCQSMVNGAKEKCQLLGDKAVKCWNDAQMCCDIAHLKAFCFAHKNEAKVAAIATVAAVAAWGCYKLFPKFKKWAQGKGLLSNVSPYQYFDVVPAPSCYCH